jgi:hypothetical protein
MNAMKVFTCTDHDGHFLSGISVIVAETELKAVNSLKKELEKAGLDPDKKFTLQELDITTRQVDMLFNGDY